MQPRACTSVLALGLSVASPACERSRPPPSPMVASPPPPPVASALQAPRDPAVVCVSAARAPQDLAIDGDLGEWGALARHPALPEACASRLAFALTGQAMSIAAELGDAARDGLLVGIAAKPAELPGMGSMFTSWAVEPLDCEHGPFWLDGTWIDGKKTPAEVGAACRVLQERYAKVEADHAKRFAKVLRVDHEGVRLVGDDDGMVAVDGAKSAWKKGPEGWSVELSLPLAAMPRVAEAPLTWLGVWARPATSPRPQLTAEDAKVVLPDPVSFEPHGALRERVFRMLVPFKGPTWVEGIQCGAAGLSYEPGDPLHVESMQYGDVREDLRTDTATVIPRREILYEKKEALGDVEVGTVHAFVEWLAILRKGELIDLIAPDPDPIGGHEATWRGAIQRDGTIHAFAYTHGDSSGPYGPRLGEWMALAIGPDGSHRNLLDGLEAAEFGCPSLRVGGRGKSFASTSFDSFGWRGEVTCEGAVPRSTLEVTYRWDDVKKRYVASARTVPLPKKRGG